MLAVTCFAYAVLCSFESVIQMVYVKLAVFMKPAKLFPQNFHIHTCMAGILFLYH